MNLNAKQPIDAADPAATVQAVCNLVEFPFKANYPESEVVELCRAAEFDIDGEGVALLLSRGRVLVPYDRRKWGANEVVTLLAYLESHRLWMANSPLHGPKKSRARLEREQFEADGVPIPHMEASSIRGLLLMMTEAQNREMREGFLEAITAKLNQQGVDLEA